MNTGRREFLGAIGAGLAATRIARAQTPAPPPSSAGGSEPSAFLAALGEAYRPKQPPVRVRKVKTTTLFQSPEKSPNAISVVPEGLWVAEQRSDTAHLMSWKGELQKSIKTQSRNTSGMAVGGGYIWMAANALPYGIYFGFLASVSINGLPFVNTRIRNASSDVRFHKLSPVFGKRIPVAKH